MSEHHAYVTVHAPLHQVYTFFTHFNDFPKFMSFVKEVTYYDEQRSHWVVEVLGTHEWDAVNQDWIPDRQIGWRSTYGLENSGRVKFTQMNPEQTQIDVFLTYTPPAGIFGAAAERLGADSHFDATLQHDLDHFAHMVEEAPDDALDPMQSHYLFHSDSAIAKGTATSLQQAAMSQDPMMHADALDKRSAIIEQEQATMQQSAEEFAAQRAHQIELERQAVQEQEQALKHQAGIDQQLAQEQAIAQEEIAAQINKPHPVYDTIGGRNASTERTAFGDQDSRGERFPMDHQDPMISRAPGMLQNNNEPAVSETKIVSPWRTAMQQGQGLEHPQDEQESAEPEHIQHNETEK